MSGRQGIDLLDDAVFWLGQPCRCRESFHCTPCRLQAEIAEYLKRCKADAPRTEATL